MKRSNSLYSACFATLLVLLAGAVAAQEAAPPSDDPATMTIAEPPESAATEGADTGEEPPSGDMGDAAASETGDVAVEEAPPLDAPAEETDEPGPDWIRGRLKLGFDGAMSRDEQDVDLEQYLRLQARPPQHPRLRLSGALWLTEDLDGSDSWKSGISDIDDTFGSDVRARLLELKMEVTGVLGGATLRLGRQRVLDGPLYNRIDGLHLKWQKPRWDAYAYAGVRASLYENSFDDFITGAGFGYRATKSTRLGIDLVHSDEDRDSGDISSPSWFSRLLGRDYPRRVYGSIDETLLALNLYQRIQQNHWLRAEVIFQEEGANEITVDLSGHVEDWRLTYVLSYRHQLERLDDQVTDLSGFYRVLGAQESFHHVHATLQRAFGEKFAAGIEGDWHASDNDSVYTANRDYFRIAAIVSGEDVYRGLDFNLALEHWDVDGGEGFWILTGEVSREWNRHVLAVGADYEQYRDELVAYNPWPQWIQRGLVLALPGVYPGFAPGVALLDERTIRTREEIYSVYASWKWTLKENQHISARLTFEEDEGPDAPYWRLRAAYELEF